MNQIIDAIEKEQQKATRRSFPWATACAFIPGLWKGIRKESRYSLA